MMNMIKHSLSMLALLGMVGCCHVTQRQLFVVEQEGQSMFENKATRAYIQEHVTLSVQQTGNASCRLLVYNRGASAVPFNRDNVMWTWHGPDGAGGYLGQAMSGPSTLESNVALIQPGQRNVIYSGSLSTSRRPLSHQDRIKAFYHTYDGFLIKASAPMQYDPDYQKKIDARNEAKRLNSESDLGITLEDTRPASK